MSKEEAAGGKRVRVLVTGSGGPAAIAVIRSLQDDPSIQLISADIDPWASGLYMVPAEDRVLLKRGDDPEFVRHLLEVCVEMEIDIVVPTVDTELEPIASSLDLFTYNDIGVLVPKADALGNTLDKLALARACAGEVRVPRTELVSEADWSSWEFPAITKPRRGSGSRGIVIVESADAIKYLDDLTDVLIQELLPGDEYSVDVLANHKGVPIAAVPRLRARVDSGVAVAGRTLVDPELEDFAKKVVQRLKLPFISNVQIRRDKNGRPALLEVNPRVPGSLALTRAAGVDMVKIAIDDLRGLPIPTEVAHREVAMVRPLGDLVVEISDLVAGV